MKKEVYIYPAIFHPEKEGGYSVFFPDLDNGATCGDDLSDALYMAKDYVATYILFGKEEKKTNFPIPTPIKEVKLKNKNDFVSLIYLDLAEYKRSIQKAVKKTVYIPRDLNDEAEELDINFSKVLREALKVELEKTKVSSR